MGAAARNIRDDEEVAVVFTAQIQVEDGADFLQTSAFVYETMNTPFYGPSARRRAENFMHSERDRDFTQADGWHWWVWASPKANEVYGQEMTDALLGRD